MRSNNLITKNQHGLVSGRSGMTLDETSDEKTMILKDYQYADTV